MMILSVIRQTAATKAPYPAFPYYNNRTCPVCQGFLEKYVEKNVFLNKNSCKYHKKMIT